MTKELLQQALNKAKASAIEVFTYENGIAKSAHDAIEYMHSWLGVYFEKQALAQQEQPASVDAYVGAREDAAIWKKRALEAEELNRKFIAELNGPTYLGEPAQQEQLAQVPFKWYDGAPPFPQNQESFIAQTIYGERVVLRVLPEEYAYDYTTADGTYMKAENIKKWMQFPDCEFLPPEPAPTQPALSDDEILNCFYASKSEGMVSYMLAVGRAIEAHCRGGANHG